MAVQLLFYSYHPAFSPFILFEWCIQTVVLTQPLLERNPVENVVVFVFLLFRC